MSAFLLSVLLFQLFTICNSNIIECIGEQSCYEKHKICDPNESCDITCKGTLKGQQACYGSKINGSSATDVSVRCIHKQDCYHTELICGTGICSIHCSGNSDRDHVDQCKFLTVDCGSSVCKINCEGRDSCQDSNFILRNAISFECVGKCPSSYPSPTHKPTKTPTAIYLTSIPSQYDTIAMTERPTTPTSIVVNTTEYYTQNTISGVNPTIEIIESEENVFVIRSILENIPLLIIFGAIIIVLICMVFTCIFYVYKMKQIPDKNIEDKNADDKKHIYNNIPMDLSNKKQNENDIRVVKTESISENRACKNKCDNSECESNEGCTAIQMGELDVFEDKNKEEVKDDELIKIKLNIIHHVKTPSSSFSNGDKSHKTDNIDGLNEDEFIVDANSESDCDYKQRKNTGGQ